VLLHINGSDRIYAEVRNPYADDYLQEGKSIMSLQYDREELYQKVWEKPLLRVAEQYGVSAVALGKVCGKLSVPVPGRGHWAKLAHGKAGVAKPALPTLDKVPIVYRSARA
jgi:hypothetical protein